ncbi:MAG: ECF transporter S component, partial [Lachnospiraceae bacterium]|nr:ECF transporter S component [Lachnospiraceae bacterium]
MNGFFGAVKDNAGFVGVCLVAVVVMCAIAYGFEKEAKKSSVNTERVLASRKVFLIGMFAA